MRRSWRRSACRSTRSSTAATTCPTGGYVPPARRAGRSARRGERAVARDVRRRGADVVAFAGVAAALERLRDAGSRLGIVTAGHRDDRRAAARADGPGRAARDARLRRRPRRSTSRTRRRSGKALELLGLADRPDGGRLRRRRADRHADGPCRRRPRGRDHVGPRRPGRAPRGRVPSRCRRRSRPGSTATSRPPALGG